MTVRRSKVSSIKKSQKESLLFKSIAQLLQQAALDDPELSRLAINRVELSDDRSYCLVYFFSDLGKSEFDKYFDKLKLYKPSLRAALANRLQSRRTPQIVFKYDDQYAKTKEVEELLERVKSDD